MKQQPKRQQDRLPSFLAEASRQAARELRQARQRAQQQELRRLRASYPSHSSKRDDFDFAKIYAETKKFVNAENLPKLKKPQQAGKATKRKILKAFDEIARRKSRGMVFYPIRGKSRIANFERLFDSSGESDIFKGGWVDAAKVNSGAAKLTFDKQGNPNFNYGDNFQAIYIPLDGPEFLENPEKYLKKKLKGFGPDQVFFPVTVRDIVCKGFGGSKSSTPPIWDVLLGIQQDSGTDTKQLGDFIGALVTYAKA